jgi:hypothetical protein
LAGRNVSGAMRPQFGGNAVFQRSILASLGRTGIVNDESHYSLAGNFLPGGVVAIR